MSAAAVSMESEDQGVTPGAALLLIVGEPFSEDHRTLILAEITKGFRCWDVEETGININEELAQIANRACLGVEGINGERIIQHQSDNLTVEILINPLTQSVKNSVKNILTAAASTKYIIYAGHVFQGSGAWVLQDDTFAFSNMAQVFRNAEVENALKQNIEANLTIHTLADSNWGAGISKADVTNNLRIQLNPPEKLDNIHGVLQFTAYVGGFVRVVPITSLLQASEQFGNISFTRPTLYIFPGCQGDSALFGISGFNFLVNGGYNRRACFWDFARHLDRVDAMLMTHLGADNIFGLSAVLQRKSLENIHPQIGYLYFNALEKPGLIPSGDGDGDLSKNPSLLINLAEEASKLTQMAKHLGISPHPCSRSATVANCEPVNLYHKLGHGSLDMYVLNPVTDSKELKEFYQLWNKQVASLDTNSPFPLPNALSICALLVWKPYNFDEKIVRILFPGNAPQHKILEGFEKMKSFGFLKLASCTTRDLMKPAPVKKPLAGSNKPLSATGKAPAKTPSSARGDLGRSMNARVESPRKETKPAPLKSETKPSSPTKPAKSFKDENNKKNLKAKEKPKVGEKEEKPKTVAAKENENKIKRDVKPAANALKGPTAHKAASPTKATPPSKSPSPPKSTSPTKTSPTKALAAAKTDESKSSAAASAVQPTCDGPAVNHVGEDDLKPESEQNMTSKPGQGEAQVLNNTISEARDAVGAVDDLPVSAANNDHKPEAQGTFNEDKSEHFAKQVMECDNGRDAYDIEEEKPQALPEPLVIVESPSQESDLPDYSFKIKSEEQELSEFSRAEEELRELDSDHENHSYDPALDIPVSPESRQEDQQEYNFPSAVEPLLSFYTPVFTNEGPAESESQPSVQKNIQYGIDDSTNERDMGGIQEVDEEEHATDGKGMRSEAVSDSKRELNVKNVDGEEEQFDDDANGFERDSIEDRDMLQAQVCDDEGIEDDSSILPPAFEKGSSAKIEKQYDPLIEQSLGENDDRDSLDGDIPEHGKSPSKVNGTVTYIPDKTNALDSKSSVGNPEQIPGFDNESDDEQVASFDPVAQWGQPMGLPSPPVENAEGRKNATARANGTDKASSSASSKKRPTTAPSATSRGASRPGSGTGTRRPGSGTSRSSPLNTKTPPLPPMTAFYVDLTYIPNHGDSAYSDVEFFKRIRARYYVISALSPNPQVLDALLEAKETWEQKDLEVTIIPTYDSDTLRHWMGLNKEKLQELRVDMTPPVCRCTIKLQDLETSLPAYRLEV